MPPPAHTPRAAPREPPAPPTLPGELLALVANVTSRLNELEQHTVPRLAQCRGPAPLHEQLAADIRQDMVTARKDVEELKLQVDDLNKARDRRAGADHVVAIQLRLEAITKQYRQAVIASKKLIDASGVLSARDELFHSAAKAGGGLSSFAKSNGSSGSRPGTPKQGDTSGQGEDDALMSATSDVTEGLRRTLQLMQQEVDRSLMSNELLQSQTQTMKMTSDQYSTFSTVLTTSKALITSLERADMLDRLILLAAILLFGLVCAWIFKRRVVNKGLRVASALGRAVSRGNGGKAVADVVEEVKHDVRAVVASASQGFKSDATQAAVLVTSAVASAAGVAKTAVSRAASQRLHPPAEQDRDKKVSRDEESVVDKIVKRIPGAEDVLDEWFGNETGGGGGEQEQEHEPATSQQERTPVAEIPIAEEPAPPEIVADTYQDAVAPPHRPDEPRPDPEAVQTIVKLAERADAGAPPVVDDRPAATASPEEQASDVAATPLATSETPVPKSPEPPAVKQPSTSIEPSSVTEEEHIPSEYPEPTPVASATRHDHGPVGPEHVTDALPEPTSTLATEAAAAEETVADIAEPEAEVSLTTEAEETLAPLTTTADDIAPSPTPAPTPIIPEAVPIDAVSEEASLPQEAGEQDNAESQEAPEVPDPVPAPTPTPVSSGAKSPEETPEPEAILSSDPTTTAATAAGTVPPTTSDEHVEQPLAGDEFAGIPDSALGFDRPGQPIVTVFKNSTPTYAETSASGSESSALEVEDDEAVFTPRKLRPGRPEVENPQKVIEDNWIGDRSEEEDEGEVVAEESSSSPSYESAQTEAEHADAAAGSEPVLQKVEREVEASMEAAPESATAPAADTRELAEPTPTQAPEVPLPTEVGSEPVSTSIPASPVETISIQSDDSAEETDAPAEQHEPATPVGEPVIERDGADPYAADPIVEETIHSGEPMDPDVFEEVVLADAAELGFDEADDYDDEVVSSVEAKEPISTEAEATASAVSNDEQGVEATEIGSDAADLPVPVDSQSRDMAEPTLASQTAAAVVEEPLKTESPVGSPSEPTAEAPPAEAAPVPVHESIDVEALPVPPDGVNDPDGITEPLEHPSLYEMEEFTEGATDEVQPATLPIDVLEDAGILVTFDTQDSLDEPGVQEQLESIQETLDEKFTIIGADEIAAEPSATSASGAPEPTQATGHVGTPLVDDSASEVLPSASSQEDTLSEEPASTGGTSSSGSAFEEMLAELGFDDDDDDDDDRDVEDDEQDGGTSSIPDSRRVARPAVDVARDSFEGAFFDGDAEHVRDEL